MNADERGVDDADLRFVTDCLGREPQGVIAIAARHREGHPSVLKNQPLIRKGQRWQPFPTLYWLVDPYVKAVVSEVERKGGVRDIEQRLQEDKALLAEHLEDNKRYAAQRWALMSESDKAAAEEHGLVQVLRDSGVGGVANHQAIKCLHAQVAYHLAMPEQVTVIKRLIEEHYGLPIAI